MAFIGLRTIPDWNYNYMYDKNRKNWHENLLAKSAKGKQHVTEVFL